jgi:primosomal protein N' (replication factor Y)
VVEALLLLNRRGFAFLLCADCGATFRCPNCAITLTFHRGRRQLRCHYCDHIETPPELCPGCRGSAIEPQGAGTERLEEELATLFPAARIARMDRDTTTRKGAHQDLVERMLREEIDILVGTQMVAKGMTFPGDPRRRGRCRRSLNLPIFAAPNLRPSLPSGGAVGRGGAQSGADPDLVPGHYV